MRPSSPGSETSPRQSYTHSPYHFSATRTLSGSAPYSPLRSDDRNTSGQLSGSVPDVSGMNRSDSGYPATATEPTPAASGVAAGVQAPTSARSYHDPMSSSPIQVSDGNTTVNVRTGSRRMRSPLSINISNSGARPQDGSNCSTPHISSPLGFDFQANGHATYGSASQASTMSQYHQQMTQQQQQQQLQQFMRPGGDSTLGSPVSNHAFNGSNSSTPAPAANGMGVCGGPGQQQSTAPIPSSVRPGSFPRHLSQSVHSASGGGAGSQGNHGLSNPHYVPNYNSSTSGHGNFGNSGHVTSPSGYPGASYRSGSQTSQHYTPGEHAPALHYQQNPYGSGPNYDSRGPSSPLHPIECLHSDHSSGSYGQAASHLNQQSNNNNNNNMHNAGNNYPRRQSNEWYSQPSPPNGSPLHSAAPGALQLQASQQKQQQQQQQQQQKPDARYPKREKSSTSNNSNSSPFAVNHTSGLKGNQPSSPVQDDASSSSYTSTSSNPKPDLPLCPNDDACPLINDRKHQSKFAHTCRLFPCYHVHLPRHTRLFRHTSEQLARRDTVSAGGKVSAQSLASVNFSSISPDAPNAYRIYVSHHNKMYEIFGDWASVKVHTFKRYLHQVYHVPPTSQVLVSSKTNKVMDDDLSCVKPYGIEEDAVIIMKLDTEVDDERYQAGRRTTVTFDDL